MVSRKIDSLIVESVVDLPVAPIFIESSTNSKPQIGRYGYVASIEQRVYVRAQQETIAYEVLSSLGHRLDVRSLKHWQRVLARNGTLPIVCIGHEDSETPLPQTAARKHGVRKHSSRNALGDGHLRRCRCP
jgi:hypothetical protein